MKSAYYIRRYIIGKWGESLASLYLIKNRFYVWKTNWRSRGGEIDIIAIKHKTLVFVEVKTRTPESAKIVAPIESITKAKLQRMELTSQKFIRSHEREILRRKIKKYRLDTILIVSSGPLYFWKKAVIETTVAARERNIDTR